MVTGRGKNGFRQLESLRELVYRRHKTFLNAARPAMDGASLCVCGTAVPRGVPVCLWLSAISRRACEVRCVQWHWDSQDEHPCGALLGTASWLSARRVLLLCEGKELLWALSS